MLNKSFNLTFATLLLAAAPAFAVDGVTLISQNIVEANGGFPYTISQTGSYRLSSDLTTNADGALGHPIAAILITASNVTLDLNGFTINGTATTATDFGYGIYVGVQNRVVVAILNGKITGFGAGAAGIYVATNGGAALIDHVSVAAAGDGIDNYGNGDLIVTNSNISAIGTSVHPGTGIYVTPEQYGGGRPVLVVRKSTVTGTYDPIDSNSPGAALVTGNTITGGNNGVEVWGVGAVTNSALFGSLLASIANTNSGVVATGANSFLHNGADNGGTSVKNNVCGNGPC